MDDPTKRAGEHDEELALVRHVVRVGAEPGLPRERQAPEAAEPARSELAATLTATALEGALWPNFGGLILGGIEADSKAIFSSPPLHPPKYP